MRVHQHALLALPALLSALVVAVPSPASYLQQPLSPPPIPQQQQQSRWKSLSNRIIESLFGLDTRIANRGPDNFRDPSYLSSRTLAQYGSDIVLRFNISTAEEAQSLAEAANTLLLDIWEFSRDWVDIRLATENVPFLLGLLPKSLQKSHTPLLRERDLAQAISNTYPAPRGRKQQTQHQDNSAIAPGRATFTPTLSKTDDPNYFFTDYQPLNVIRPWLRLLASLFTTHVRLISIGTSYESRDIPALRVGVHPTNNEDPNPPRRKTVLVTGGLHAREWIGTSTVNYVAYSLITGYGKNAEITTLLENFDFVFIPTLNPDGYIYSWETDRLWRKNRQNTSVRFCQGIDLDHGFSFEWESRGGAGNPCSEAFAGKEAFDAVESRRLADWAKNETERNDVEFVGFLDLHSYSQEILYPYSYSCADVPPGQENLEELALGLEKAIRISSSFSYETMPACEGNVANQGKRTILPRIEEGGGSALDWFYHEMHVRYAYQIKLRDRGTYGFLLPKENIIPTGKEILEAVLYFGRFLQEEVHPLGVDDDKSDAIIVSDVAEDKDNRSQAQEEEDDWVIVEDIMFDEDEQEGVKIDLRRRWERG